MAPTVRPRLNEGASAILLDPDGRLLLQLRDNVPHIRDPGKIGLFGGGREGNESFLECVVREVHEEIGYYLPPERFQPITCWTGPDHAFPDSTFHGEVFLARNVPVESLIVSEGSLKIVAVNELEKIRHNLTLPAKYALEIFLCNEGLSIESQLVGDLKSAGPRARQSSPARSMDAQMRYHPRANR
jgi:8-oxo-dGTP diphosphatase